MARGSLRVIAGLETVLAGRLVSRRGNVSTALEFHVTGLVDTILKDGILDSPAVGGVNGPFDRTAQGLTGEVLDVLGGKLDLQGLEVLLDALGSDTLGDGDDVTSERPCEQDLGGRDVVPLGNVNDNFVLEVLGYVLVGTKGE